MKEFIEFLDQQEETSPFSSHVCSFKVKLFFSEVDEFENVSVKKNVTYVMHLADRLEAGISVRKKYFGNNKITGIPFDMF